MNRKQLQRCRQRLCSRLPLVGGWLRRQAVQALAAASSVEAVRLLAEAVERSDDPRVRTLAAQALRRLTNPRHVEAACEVWLETRGPQLGALLGAGQWLTQAPLRAQVFHALKYGRPEVIEAVEARAIDHLLQACRDPDPEVAEAARRVLGALKTVEGRETLCRRAMQPDSDPARAVAVAAGYAPRDAQQRALFYFLTDQWAAYEALDFDQSLLRAAYQSADEATRRHVAARARQVGRTEWVTVATGGRQRLRLGDMTDSEWQVTLDVLVTQRQWPELWQLAQEAPASWSARLLKRLAESGWHPADRTTFDELIRLAEGWWQPDLAALVDLRTELTGHGGAITGLAITPDGALLASGSDDGTVRLWNLPAGRLRRELSGHTGGVTCLALSPDGRTLFSGARDSNLRRWRLPEGEPLAPLTGHEQVTHCLAASPDGKLLAGALYDQTVCLWDVTAGCVVARLKTFGAQVPERITSLAIDPASRLLAAASQDRTVRLWGLPEGAPRGLEGRSALAAAAISPDGLSLAAGSYDREILLWRLPTGEPLARLEGHQAEVMGVAFHPDGRLLASGGHDRTVRLWGLPERRLLRELTGALGPITCLAFSLDGRVLATGGKERVVRLWNLLPLRVAQAPAGRLNLNDLARIEELTRDGVLAGPVRAALAFAAALIRARRQCDVAIQEVPRRVAVGAFDIEIVG